MGDCPTCNDTKWVLDPDPENRSWLPCDCALEPAVVRALSCLDRLSDGHVSFASAAVALKRHPHFKEAQSDA